MNRPALETRAGVVVDGAAIDAFVQAFAGPVILPSDPGYDAARQIWNAGIDRHPGMIARCAGVADVVQAVDFARANDLVVAVRGGGHNVGGRALCDRGIVIDLSGMRAVHVDPVARTVRVQGGATLADVDRETHLFGLAVPLGVVSRTGVGGLTLGGGVGWLVRKYGPTCDNVLSCEVVTAEGKIVTATAHENADLFWALRGGGGNFGVVTSFLYQAYPVSTVLGGLIIYPRDQAGAVLRHYRGIMATAPVELTAYGGLLCTPDGTPAVGVIACHCGDAEQAVRDMKPLREFGSPMLDAIQPIPFPAMQRLLDDAFPDRAYNYWKSAFVRELSDGLIDTLIDHANRARSPQSAIVMEFYGGAGGRVGEADNAFAQRRAEFDVGIMAQWLDPAESEEHTAWARAGAEALKTYATGHLLNFLPEEDRDTIRAAFGDSYPKLQELKRKYDPTNFFRLNQNILPTT